MDEFDEESEASRSGEEMLDDGVEPYDEEALAAEEDIDTQIVSVEWVLQRIETVMQENPAKAGRFTAIEASARAHLEALKSVQAQLELMDDGQKAAMESQFGELRTRSDELEMQYQELNAFDDRSSKLANDLSPVLDKVTEYRNKLDALTTLSSLKDFESQLLRDVIAREMATLLMCQQALNVDNEGAVNLDVVDECLQRHKEIEEEWIAPQLEKLTQRNAQLQPQGAPISMLTYQGTRMLKMLNGANDLLKELSFYCPNNLLAQQTAEQVRTACEQIMVRCAQLPQAIHRNTEMDLLQQVEQYNQQLKGAESSHSQRKKSGSTYGILADSANEVDSRRVQISGMIKELKARVLGLNGVAQLQQGLQGHLWAMKRQSEMQKEFLTSHLMRRYQSPALTSNLWEGARSMPDVFNLAQFNLNEAQAIRVPQQQRQEHFATAFNVLSGLGGALRQLNSPFHHLMVGFTQDRNVQAGYESLQVTLASLENLTELPTPEQQIRLRLEQLEELAACSFLEDARNREELLIKELVGEPYQQDETKLRVTQALKRLAALGNPGLPRQDVESLKEQLLAQVKSMAGLSEIEFGKLKRRYEEQVGNWRKTPEPMNSMPDDYDRLHEFRNALGTESKISTTSEEASRVVEQSESTSMTAHETKPAKKVRFQNEVNVSEAERWMSDDLRPSESAPISTQKQESLNEEASSQVKEGTSKKTKPIPMDLKDLGVVDEYQATLNEAPAPAQPTATEASSSSKKRKAPEQSSSPTDDWTEKNLADLNDYYFQKGKAWSPSPSIGNIIDKKPVVVDNPEGRAETIRAAFFEVDGGGRIQKVGRVDGHDMDKALKQKIFDGEAVSYTPENFRKKAKVQGKGGLK